MTRDLALFGSLTCKFLAIEICRFLRGKIHTRAPFLHFRRLANFSQPLIPSALPPSSATGHLVYDVNKHTSISTFRVASRSPRMTPSRWPHHTLTCNPRIRPWKIFSSASPQANQTDTVSISDAVHHASPALTHWPRALSMRDEHSIRGSLAVSLRRSHLLFNVSPCFEARHSPKSCNVASSALLSALSSAPRDGRPYVTSHLSLLKSVGGRDSESLSQRPYPIPPDLHAKATASAPLTRRATSINKVQQLACRKKSFSRFCRMTASLFVIHISFCHPRTPRQKSRV